MKSKIILAVVALICSFSFAAEAQGRHGRGQYANNNGYNNGYNNHYNNGYNNGCNNGYRGGNGYRGNGYGRGYYRPRPVAYCQPVVIAPRPRYCPPPRYAYGRGYGRPRVNINIGF